MAQVDKSQFPEDTQWQWEQNQAAGQKEEVPAWVDYINPDGSWHVNYAFYDPPPPSADEIARAKIAQTNKWVQLQPAQGMFTNWMPSVDQLRAWRPEWIKGG
ncbi:MAG: hypothetical protein E6Q97_10390 [Desulfurellales bacterium]|nr:MAG: hypothetical protein E6Q97_10390 [Desulfurellales bacterium]